MQDTEKTRGGFQTAGTVLGVLIFIYLALPVAYALPLRILCGRAAFYTPAFRIAFWPID